MMYYIYNDLEHILLMSSENPFLHACNLVRHDDLPCIVMSRYCDPHLTTAEANSLDWANFKSRMPLLGVIKPREVDIDFAVTSKDTPWTPQDVNVFLGRTRSPNQIIEFDDLADEELLEFFKFHRQLTDGLMSRGYDTIQVTHGFNPLDISPGHHSLTRFHTHVRSVDNKIDARIQNKPWMQYDWFQRLSAVEPSTPIFKDIFEYLSKNQGIFPGSYFDIKPSGYLSFDIAVATSDTDLARMFSGFYKKTKQIYHELTSIFSDGSEDKYGRYLPRSQEDRSLLLKDYLAANPDLFGDQSKLVLAYLARRLVPAEERTHDRRVRIDSARQVHITKGFAGGISFTRDIKSKTMEIDFFPRTITTTGPTKNLFRGHTYATFIKDSDEPSQEQRQLKLAYERDIVELLKSLKDM